MGSSFGVMSFRGKAGSKPDSAKWTYDLGDGGWGNHELETYTDSTKNASVDGKGHLVIRAEKDAAGRFSSARRKTQRKFAFTDERAAARMKLPRGQWMWPAFWMLGTNIEKAPWPGCGEVDVMESLGRDIQARMGFRQSTCCRARRSWRISFMFMRWIGGRTGMSLPGGDMLPLRVPFVLRVIGQ